MLKTIWFLMVSTFAFVPVAALSQSLPDEHTKSKITRSEEVKNMEKRQFHIGVVAKGLDQVPDQFEIIASTHMFCDVKDPALGRPKRPYKKINVPYQKTKTALIDRKSATAQVLFTAREFGESIVPELIFHQEGQAMSALADPCELGPSYGIIVTIWNKTIDQLVGQTYIVEEAFGEPLWEMVFRGEKVSFKVRSLFLNLDRTSIHAPLNLPFDDE